MFAIRKRGTSKFISPPSWYGSRLVQIGRARNFKTSQNAVQYLIDSKRNIYDFEVVEVKVITKLSVVNTKEQLEKYKRDKVNALKKKYEKDLQKALQQMD